MWKRRSALVAPVASAIVVPLIFLAWSSVPPDVPDSFDAEWCEGGWRVTGYFIPEERDYSGDLVDARAVSLDGARETQLRLREDFLSAVMKEGWGLMSDGRYVGWWDGRFRGPEDRAYDFQGNELDVSTVAVDTSVIPHGKSVAIPTLPDPWNGFVFNASDVGETGVRGRHVDVFTGSGRAAENETFRITGDDNTVCVGSAD